MTLDTLLQRLRIEGHLDDGSMSRLSAHIVAQNSPANYPWFIKAAIAFGAWVAAISFLFFFGAIGYFTAKGSLVVIGILAIGVATIVRRLLSFEFTNQLALASSIAGHCMIFIWLFDQDHQSPVSRIAIASAILCAILYPLYRDVVHRFLSCLLSQTMFLIWIVSLDHPNRIYVLILLQSVVTVFLFTQRSLTGRGLTTAERPLAYATVISLIASVATTTFLPAFPGNWSFMLWPAKIGFSIILIYLYWWVTRREGRAWTMAMTTAVVITIALGIMAAPGILLAVAIMIIGYERDDGLLVGIGIAIFPFFIWFYYYNLNLSLMRKSLILIGSGVILLAARLYMSRFSDEDRRPEAMAVAQGARQ
jgi:uncharacterized membrane protein